MMLSEIGREIETVATKEIETATERLSVFEDDCTKMTDQSMREAAKE